MLLRAFLLAFLVSYCYAGTLNVRGSASQLECATSCATTAGSVYDVGKIYSYEYSGVILTTVEGAYQEKVGMRIMSNVMIEVITPCQMSMTLQNVLVSEHNPTDPGKFLPTQYQQEFKSNLEANSLQFKFNSGSIETLCINNQDAEWIVNIKRGILSLFQNKIAANDRKNGSFVTDISGKCPVNYVDLSTGVDEVRIKEMKTLGACTDRQHIMGALQSTSYRANSTIQSIPLVDGTLECVKVLTPGGRVKKISCFEVQIFRPSHFGNNGATSKVQQELTFKEEKVQRSLKLQDNSVAYRTSNLLYKHNANLPKSSEQKQLVISMLQKINTVMQDDVRPETATLFTELVTAMKPLSKSEMDEIHQVLTRDFVDNANRRKTIVMFQDAMPLLQTFASIEFMKDLVLNKKVSTIEANIWFTSLAYVTNPTIEMIVSLTPLLQDNQQRQALLGITSLIHQFCKSHQTSNCAEMDEIKRIESILMSNLNGDCKTLDSDGVNQMLALLKAIGNAGCFRNVVSVLEKCIKRADNPMEIKVTAVEAFRRMECSVIQKSELSKIMSDEKLDSELRIVAYLSIMRCATQKTIDEISGIMRNEQVNQFASFVWTHLQNLKETSSPLKQDISRLLEDKTLRSIFQSDKLQFSKNIEKSFFIESLNVGAQVESNLIWSQNSFVPRSASMNLTVDAFGDSFNLFEINSRVEGLEAILEKYFGPQGYFSPNGEKPRNNDKPVDNKPMAVESTIQMFDKKYKFDGEKLKALFGVKIFGNDIGFLNLFTEQYPKLNILEILLELTTERSAKMNKNLIFLDTSICLPSSMGLPLKLAVSGTAIIDLKVKAKLDIRNMMLIDPNFDILSELEPSSVLEMQAKMGVTGFYGDYGVKMVANVHSSTKMHARMTVTAGAEFKVEFETSKDKQEIISASTKFFLINGKNLREQTAASNTLVTRSQKKVCTPDTLSQLFGMELCAEYDIPNTLNNDNALSILTSPSSASIYVQKRDTHRSYLMTIMHKFSKTNRHGGFSPDNQRFQFLFDTPGSKVNRKFSTEFELNFDDNAISANLVTPWKQLSLSGALTNRAGLQKIALQFFMDNQNLLNVNCQLNSRMENQRIVYNPIVEVNVPGLPVINIESTAEFELMEKLYFDFKMQNLLRSPLQFTILLQNVPAKREIQGKYAFMSHFFNTHFTSKFSSQDGEAYLTLVGEYHTISSKKHTLQWKNTYLHKNAGDSFLTTTVEELESSQYPQYNHKIVGKFERSKRGHDINIIANYGLNLKHKYTIQIQGINKMVDSIDANWWHYSAFSSQFPSLQFSGVLNINTSRGELLSLSHIHKVGQGEQIYEISNVNGFVKFNRQSLVSKFESTFNGVQIWSWNANADHSEDFSAMQLLLNSTYLRSNVKLMGSLNRLADESYITKVNVTRNGGMMLKLTGLFVPSVTNSKMDVNITYDNSKEYRLTGFYISKMNAESMTLDYSLMLQTNDRLIKALGSLLIGRTDFSLKHEVFWNAKRDDSQALSFEISYGYKTTGVYDQSFDSLFRLTFPGNSYASKINFNCEYLKFMSRFMVEWSPTKKIEVVTMYDINNGWTEKGLIATATLKTPWSRFENTRIGVNLLGQLNYRKADIEFVWGIDNKRILATLIIEPRSANDMSATLKIISPFAKFSYVKFHFKHLLTDNEFTSDLVTEFRTQKVHIGLKGINNSHRTRRDVSLQGNFETSFESFPSIVFVVDHVNDGEQIRSQLNFKWSENKEITAKLGITNKRLPLGGLSSIGMIEYTTPLETYKAGHLKWNFAASPKNVKLDVDLTYKPNYVIALNLVGNNDRLFDNSRQISGFMSLKIPTIELMKMTLQHTHQSNSIDAFQSQSSLMFSNPSQILYGIESSLISSNYFQTGKAIVRLKTLHSLIAQVGSNLEWDFVSNNKILKADLSNNGRKLFEMSVNNKLQAIDRFQVKAVATFLPRDNLQFGTSLDAQVQDQKFMLKSSVTKTFNGKSEDIVTLKSDILWDNSIQFSVRMTSWFKQFLHCNTLFEVNSAWTKANFEMDHNASIKLTSNFDFNDLTNRNAKLELLVNAIPYGIQFVGQSASNKWLSSLAVNLGRHNKINGILSSEFSTETGFYRVLNISSSFKPLSLIELTQKTNLISSQFSEFYTAKVKSNENLVAVEYESVRLNHVATRKLEIITPFKACNKLFLHYKFAKINDKFSARVQSIWNEHVADISGDYTMNKDSKEVNFALKTPFEFLQLFTANVTSTGVFPRMTRKISLSLQSYEKQALIKSKLELLGLRFINVELDYVNTFYGKSNDVAFNFQFDNKYSGIKISNGVKANKLDIYAIEINYKMEPSDKNLTFYIKTPFESLKKVELQFALVTNPRTLHYKYDFAIGFEGLGVEIGLKNQFELERLNYVNVEITLTTPFDQVRKFQAKYMHQGLAKTKKIQFGGMLNDDKMMFTGMFHSNLDGHNTGARNFELYMEKQIRNVYLLRTLKCELTHSKFMMEYFVNSESIFKLEFGSNLSQLDIGIRRFDLTLYYKYFESNDEKPEIKFFFIIENSETKKGLITELVTYNPMAKKQRFEINCKDCNRVNGKISIAANVLNTQSSAYLTYSFDYLNPANSKNKMFDVLINLPQLGDIFFQVFTILSQDVTSIEARFHIPKLFATPWLLEAQLIYAKLAHTFSFYPNAMFKIETTLKQFQKLQLNLSTILSTRQQNSFEFNVLLQSNNKNSKLNFYSLIKDSQILLTSKLDWIYFDWDASLTYNYQYIKVQEYNQALNYNMNIQISSSKLIMPISIVLDKKNSYTDDVIVSTQIWTVTSHIVSFILQMDATVKANGKESFVKYNLKINDKEPYIFFNRILLKGFPYVYEWGVETPLDSAFKKAHFIVQVSGRGDYSAILQLHPNLEYKARLSHHLTYSMFKSRLTINTPFDKCKDIDLLVELKNLSQNVKTFNLSLNHNSFDKPITLTANVDTELFNVSVKLDTPFDYPGNAFVNFAATKSNIKSEIFWDYLDFNAKLNTTFKFIPGDVLIAADVRITSSILDIANDLSVKFVMLSEDLSKIDMLFNIDLKSLNTGEVLNVIHLKFRGMQSITLFAETMFPFLQSANLEVNMQSVNTLLINLNVISYAKPIIQVGLEMSFNDNLNLFSISLKSPDELFGETYFKIKLDDLKFDLIMYYKGFAGKNELSWLTAISPDSSVTTHLLKIRSPYSILEKFDMKFVYYPWFIPNFAFRLSHNLLKSEIFAELKIMPTSAVFKVVSPFQYLQDLTVALTYLTERARPIQLQISVLHNLLSKPITAEFTETIDSEGHLFKLVLMTPWQVTEKMSASVLMSRKPYFKTVINLSHTYLRSDIVLVFQLDTINLNYFELQMDTPFDNALKRINILASKKIGDQSESIASLEYYPNKQYRVYGTNSLHTNSFTIAFNITTPFESIKNCNGSLNFNWDNKLLVDFSIGHNLLRTPITLKMLSKIDEQDHLSFKMQLLTPFDKFSNADVSFLCNRRRPYLAINGTVDYQAYKQYNLQFLFDAYGGVMPILNLELQSPHDAIKKLQVKFDNTFDKYQVEAKLLVNHNYMSEAIVLTTVVTKEKMDLALNTPLKGAWKQVHLVLQRTQNANKQVIVLSIVHYPEVKYDLSFTFEKSNTATEMGLVGSTPYEMFKTVALSVKLNTLPQETTVSWKLIHNLLKKEIIATITNKLVNNGHVGIIMLSTPFDILEQVAVNWEFSLFNKEYMNKNFKFVINHSRLPGKIAADYSLTKENNKRLASASFISPWSGHCLGIWAIEQQNLITTFNVTLQHNEQIASLAVNISLNPSDLLGHIVINTPFEALKSLDTSVRIKLDMVNDCEQQMLALLSFKHPLIMQNKALKIKFDGSSKICSFNSIKFLGSIDADLDKKYIATFGFIKSDEQLGFNGEMSIDDKTVVALKNNLLWKSLTNFKISLLNQFFDIYKVSAMLTHKHIGPNIVTVFDTKVLDFDSILLELNINTDDLAGEIKLRSSLTKFQSASFVFDKTHNKLETGVSIFFQDSKPVRFGLMCETGWDKVKMLLAVDTNIATMDKMFVKFEAQQTQSGISNATVTLQLPVIGKVQSSFAYIQSHGEAKIRYSLNTDFQHFKQIESELVITISYFSTLNSVTFKISSASLPKPIVFNFNYVPTDDKKVLNLAVSSPFAFIEEVTSVFEYFKANGELQANGIIAGLPIGDISSSVRVVWNDVYGANLDLKIASNTFSAMFEHMLAENFSVKDTLALGYNDRRIAVEVRTYLSPFKVEISITTPLKSLKTMRINGGLDQLLSRGNLKIIVDDEQALSISGESTQESIDINFASAFKMLKSVNLKINRQNKDDETFSNYELSTGSNYKLQGSTKTTANSMEASLMFETPIKTYKRSAVSFSQQTVDGTSENLLKLTLLDQYYAEALMRQNKDKKAADISFKFLNSDNLYAHINGKVQFEEPRSLELNVNMPKHRRFRTFHFNATHSGQAWNHYYKSRMVFNDEYRFHHECSFNAKRWNHFNVMHKISLPHNRLQEVIFESQVDSDNGAKFKANVKSYDKQHNYFVNFLPKLKTENQQTSLLWHLKFKLPGYFEALRLDGIKLEINARGADFTKFNSTTRLSFELDSGTKYFEIQEIILMNLDYIKNQEVRLKAISYKNEIILALKQSNSKRLTQGSQIALYSKLIDREFSMQIELNKTDLVIEALLPSTSIRSMALKLKHDQSINFVNLMFQLMINQQNTFKSELQLENPFRNMLASIGIFDNDVKITALYENNNLNVKLTTPWENLAVVDYKMFHLRQDSSIEHRCSLLINDQNVVSTNFLSDNLRNGKLQVSLVLPNSNTWILYAEVKDGEYQMKIVTPYRQIDARSRQTVVLSGNVFVEMKLKIKTVESRFAFELSSNNKAISVMTSPSQHSLYFQWNSGKIDLKLITEKGKVSFLINNDFRLDMQNEVLSNNAKIKSIYLTLQQKKWGLEMKSEIGQDQLKITEIKFKCLERETLIRIASGYTANSYRNEFMLNWDLTSKSLKQAGWLFNFEKINANSYKGKLELIHPLIKSKVPVFVESVVTFNSGKQYLNFHSNLQYTSNPNDNVKFTTEIYEDNMGRCHLRTTLFQKSSRLNIDNLITVGFKQNGYNFEVSNSYLDNNDQILKFNCRLYINTSTNAFLISSSYPKRVTLTGSVNPTAIGYVIGFNLVEGIKNRLNGTLTLEGSPTLSMKIYDETEAMTKILHVRSSFVDNKNFQLTINRQYRDTQTNDFMILIKLKSQHLLNSKLYWRPAAIFDFHDYIARKRNMLQRGVNDMKSQIMTFVMKEFSAKQSLLAATVPDLNTFLKYSENEWLNYKSDCLKCVHFVIKLIKDNENLNAMYDVSRVMMTRLTKANKQIVRRVVRAVSLVTEPVQNVMWDMATMSRNVWKNNALRRSFSEFMGSIIESIKPAFNQIMRLISFTENTLTKLCFRMVSYIINFNYNLAQGFMQLLTQDYAELFSHLHHGIRQYLLARKGDVHRLTSQYTTTLQTLKHEVDQLVTDLLSDNGLKYGVTNYIQKMVSWLYDNLNIEQSIKKFVDLQFQVIMNYLGDNPKFFLNHLRVFTENKVIIYDPEQGTIETELYLPVQMNDLKSSPDFTSLRNDYEKLMDKTDDAYENVLGSRRYVTSTIDAMKAAIKMHTPSLDFLDKNYYIPNFQASAIILANHVLTFDNAHFDLIQGSCSYLLSADFKSRQWALKMLNNNEREYSLQIYDKIITFRLQNKVYVDGEIVELPYVFKNLTIMFDGGVIKAQDLAQGIYVVYDSRIQMLIFGLTGWYHNKVGGLLGNYDNEHYNDFTKSNGQITTNVNEHVLSSTIGSCSQNVVAKSDDSNSNTPITATGMGHSLCEFVFNSPLSRMNKCFKHVNTRHYYKMCVEDVKLMSTGNSRHRLCGAATAYATQCRKQGIKVKMPLICNRCDVQPNLKMLEVNNKVNIVGTKTLVDIVFVVEERGCNQDIVPLLRNIVESSETSFGSHSINYGLVGFGDKRHSLEGNAPHTHTIDSTAFGNASSFAKSLTNYLVDYQSKNSEDLYPAIKFAAMTYAFRPTAARHIILIPCSECNMVEYKTQEIQNLLQKQSIVFHVLSKRDDLDQLFENEDIVGIAPNKLYYRDRVLDVSEPPLSLNNNRCLNLAINTNGTVFSAATMTEMRIANQQLAIRQYTNAVKLATVIPKTVQCECMIYKDQPKLMCKNNIN